jgi:hypothetical protein
MSAVNFKVVYFNNGCFIANVEPYCSSYNDQIASLLFDGVKATQSCKKRLV